MSAEAHRVEDQLKRAFEGDAWHGPAVLEVLQGVTAARATAKPVPGAHSIWEIVLHIAVWEDVARRRLSGEPVGSVPPAQDWPPANGSDEAAWSAALAALRSGHQALRRTIAKLSDARLQEKVPDGEYTNYLLAHGVIQHDLYHAGQIALLKKA
jgi:uncharacterized damage-inducible protein DinB